MNPVYGEDYGGVNVSQSICNKRPAKVAANVAADIQIKTKVSILSNLARSS